MMNTYILVFVFLVVWFLYRNTKKPRGFPPGPFRVPIFGYGPNIDTRLPFRTWDKLRATYGEVFGIYAGSVPTVVVNGWEAVKEGLLNDDLSGRPPFITNDDISQDKGKGIMFANGDLWKEQRRFTLFHMRNLGFGKMAYEQVIHEEAHDLITDLKDNCGKPFNIQIEGGVSSVNIIWAIIAGQRFKRTDLKLKHLIENLEIAFRAGEISQGFVGIFPSIRHYLPESSNYKTVMKGMRGVSNTIKKSVKEHKDNFKEEELNDFLDIYIKEMKQKGTESYYSDTQMAAICQDLFAAGTDTSASFLGFAVMFLCFHPEMQHRMQIELDEVVGRKNLPSTEDRANLVFVDAFLNEVMRIRSPAPHTIPHEAYKDTNLQGHRIPKGTFLVFNMRSVLMDEDFWGDPQQFRPERFIEGGKIKKIERMIPFGKGRRVCLGEPLARMTNFILFTSLVQNFSFKFGPEGPPADTEGSTGFTLGPPEFKVIATPR